jgi:hypothetical protein
MSRPWSRYDADALQKAACDPNVLKPDWDAGGFVHNWRRYVGQYTKGIWWSLTPDQKAAIVLDADERAGQEDWD